MNSFEDFFVFVFVLDIVATDAAMPPPACVTASHPIFPALQSPEVNLKHATVTKVSRAGFLTKPNVRKQTNSLFLFPAPSVHFRPSDVYIYAIH